MIKLLDRYRLRSLRVDASTLCQLRCPVCLEWGLQEKYGRGYLSFESFKMLADSYPFIRNFELSNKGEAFLNPDLSKIMEYAHAKRLKLTLYGGVNFNSVSETILKNLVKYKFRSLTISIDGASDETYKVYRIGGCFDAVIANIKRLNYYKKKHKSLFPKLRWKFVIFGHNEHEISKARRMAAELKMDFCTVFNFSDGYSPIMDKELVKKQTGYASRQEEEAKKGYLYTAAVCRQMFEEPQINWDGELQGCCMANGASYGNVLQSGLLECMASERFRYAQAMLTGEEGPRDDVPCSKCCVYQWRLKHSRFLRRPRGSYRMLQILREYWWGALELAQQQYYNAFGWFDRGSRDSSNSK